MMEEMCLFGYQQPSPAFRLGLKAGLDWFRKKRCCTCSVAISIPDCRPSPESENKDCEGLHNIFWYGHAGFSEFIDIRIHLLQDIFFCAPEALLMNDGEKPQIILLFHLG